MDEIPIRVLKNNIEKGGSYPTQAMKRIGTIWTSTWASNGKPVNWKSAPFQAHYRGFQIHACQSQTHHNHNHNDEEEEEEECHSSKFWWNHEKYWTLDSLQLEAYNKVRNQYMNYDYCSKSKNPECL